MLKIVKQGKRLIVAVIGLTILGIGIAMIVLPGPAILVIPLGLSILATEFVWAKRFLEKMKDRLKKTYKSSTKPMERSNQLKAGETRSDYGHKKPEERKRTLKKIIVGRGIIGIVFILIIWGLAAGAGFLWDILPQWVDDGEKIVSEAIQKVEKVFPGAKESIESVAPGLIQKVKETIPEMSLPAKDIGGEDIRPIPRHTDMVRVSYSVSDKNKTVVYKGKTALSEARDFYKNEMAVLGFREKVVSVSPEQEVYQYVKGTQELEFKFRKIPTIRLEITEMMAKEL